jgi:beta-phosphoglucomutase-like phosphatase (HAD superfamily)
MCRKDYENTHLADGAVEFLNYIKENNIPRTIATMSEKDNVDFYIEEFKLEQWFDLDKIVYADGTVAGKPAPDIYLKAAQKLNLNPKDCIVVEDAISGIEAARAANIGKIIAIASMESVELYKNIPAVSQIIKNFNEIDRTIFSNDILTFANKL